MSSTIQMMSVTQPSPDMISEENYEVGEIILPHYEGGWTLYSILPIYHKEGTTEQMVPHDLATGIEVGQNASFPVRVIWVAAEQEAFNHTSKEYHDALRQAQLQQNAQKTLVLAR